MSKVTEIFGLNVFNDSVMKERLPKNVYKALKDTIMNGSELDPKTADVIALSMKDWAIEKGATHYSHWFQPMTGITAEKHDSFISPTSDGKVIMEFSGKELIKGEPDASSFPSGGLRATFEARGYTAWDCTSPAFVRDGILCIPTAFCSYTGHALDKKTPLLRSMEALSKQALRLLKIFGNTTTKRVITSVGPEQEYFLIEKKYYDLRKDLIFTGRTLFGALPPKGQELEDHYFGSIKERISSYMSELNDELWKVGVTAKTQHNEVAPAQHEIAPIFASSNIATDHNQLIMDLLKKVALRHGLVCLLHEKPFAGVNGSGKHNNWSMDTDDGINLLDPGKTPHENIQFLVFLCAVIKSVDDYADLLRLSAANPGNDHRLGANEAPPAIISIFLGEQLTDLLEKIENGKEISSSLLDDLKIGVSTIPPLPKDSTDRNRTSPFAFTSKKFEFRMPPSAGSIAGPNFVLNTIVAQTLGKIADRLENAENPDDEIQVILKEIVSNHKKVIFNGNNYSDEWIKEAERRGLPNISNMVDACKILKTDRIIELFETHNVLYKDELEARYEILLENYVKTINIEALTAIDMASRQLLPASMKFAASLADSINAVKNTGIDASTDAQAALLKEVSGLCTKLKDSIKELKASVTKASEIEAEDIYVKACEYRDNVTCKMNSVRNIADKLEEIVAEDLWPIPTYSDLLFRV